MKQENIHDLIVASNYICCCWTDIWVHVLYQYYCVYV